MRGCENRGLVVWKGVASGGVSLTRKRTSAHLVDELSLSAKKRGGRSVPPSRVVRTTTNWASRFHSRMGRKFIFPNVTSQIIQSTKYLIIIR